MASDTSTKRAVRYGSTIVAILFLALLYAASRWVVARYTQPGHMSVIEAQAMDMSAMRPPVGPAPVAVTRVERRTQGATLRYTGAVVGYVEQDVTPRVTGTIVWMPLYPGDHVRQGQAIVRLDTAELHAREQEQASGVTMAIHASDVAQHAYAQALAVAAQSRAQVAAAQDNVAAAQSDVAEARQEVAAAGQDRVGAREAVVSARSSVTGAQKQLDAARAAQTRWADQLKRSQALERSGAISVEEYQQDLEQAQTADADVGKAQADLAQMQAGVRDAQSRLSKSGALEAAAQAKVAAAGAALQARSAEVTQAQDNARAMAAAADTEHHEILHTRAGIQQAQAGLSAATVVAGYTQIVAQTDGVVTDRLISPGVLVQPGQVILKIAQIRPIRAQVSVAQTDLPNIHVGNPVRIEAPKLPGRNLFAHVTSIFPSADPESRTSIVEAVVPNTDGSLLPGDYISMEITTGHAQYALTVPASAVVHAPVTSSHVNATTTTAAVWTMVQGTPGKIIWTCTMHPQIRENKPGKCPI